MNKKPVLMIHEVREEMLKLPLQNYILTFDDALYSQYYYFKQLQAFNTEMVFFVSSGIVADCTQSTEFPACNVAHEKAFNGNFEDYMSVEQIREILKAPLTSIGAHSHSHTRLSQFTKLIDKVQYIAQDTAMCVNWFKENLGFAPTKFCFPYNEDLDGMYKGLLKAAGFTEFYGSERIPIETLLLPQSQLESHDTLLAWSLPRHS